MEVEGDVVEDEVFFLLQLLSQLVQVVKNWLRTDRRGLAVMCQPQALVWVLHTNWNS